jgi:hypothetical protein
MIKLTGLRLSSNPNAVVDGKFNVTSDGRKYLIAEFINPKNPFAGTIRRMIAQQFDSLGNAYWKVNPSNLKIGELYDGDVVTSKVEPYVIGDREVTTYTGVVFAHENIETVLKNANHQLAETVQSKKVVSEVVEELAS